MSLGRRAAVKVAAAALWAILVAVLPDPAAAFSASVPGRIPRWAATAAARGFPALDPAKGARKPPLRLRLSPRGRLESAGRVGGALRMADGSETVVLVCTGDECEESGSDAILKYARKQKPDGVVCKSTGCLGMCGVLPAVRPRSSPPSLWLVHLPGQHRSNPGTQRGWLDLLAHLLR
jgi:hypothetical protein